MTLWQSVGQETSLDQTVNTLKTKISISQKGEKLLLLDSLTRLVEFNEDYNYTVLAQETINLGIAIDSIHLATAMAADQLFYQINVLNKPQKGLALYEEYLKKIPNLNTTPVSANLHLYAGDAYNSFGKLQEAIDLFQKSLETSKKAGRQDRIAVALRRSGFTKGNMGEFADASKEISESYAIYTQLQDTLNMINCKNELSILYSQNQFWEEAAKERQEAIALSSKDDGALYSVHYNAAADAREQNDLLGWITNMEKSLEESEKTLFKEFIQPNILNNLIIAHASNNNIDRAEEYLKKVESDPEKYTKGPSEDYYIEAKKNLAFAKANYIQALKLGTDHLQRKKEQQSFVEIYNAENFLAATYEKLGNTTQATIHKNEYYRIKDSVSTSQKVKALSYYQTLYETEKKDSKIKEQESSLELLETKSRLRNQWFLIAAILGILGFIIFYLNTQYKQKVEKQEAVEKLRVKISADLHDDVGSLLTGLAMQSEILGKNAPDNLANKLDRISELSRSAMLKMRDAVWVMDARKDNWQSLIDRINEFASELLGAKDLRYQLKHANRSNEEEMEGATRQHLYLVVKEAVANIIKHSNADSVEIDLSKNKSEILLSIKDNGKVEKQESAGLGISNMKHRIEELSGKLEVNTTNGYEIAIKIPA